MTTWNDRAERHQRWLKREQARIDWEAKRERRKRGSLIAELDRLNGKAPEVKSQEWLDRHPIVEVDHAPWKRKAFAVVKAKRRGLPLKP